MTRLTAEITKAGLPVPNLDVCAKTQQMSVCKSFIDNLDHISPSSVSEKILYANPPFSEVAHYKQRFKELKETGFDFLNRQEL